MTIRLRLALTYGAAVAITLTLVGVVVWYQFGRDLRQSLEQTLQARASSIATTLENEGQTGLQEPDASAAGSFVALFDSAGALADASADAPPGLTPATPSEWTVGHVRYAVYRLHSAAGMDILTGASLAPVAQSQASLAGLLLLIGVPAVLGSVLAGYLLAGGALRPVARLTAEASSIDADDLRRRLPQPPRNDELGRLARTLNALLERVADAMVRQRAFIAAASHDLRTPIAALAAELELAETGPPDVEHLRSAVRVARADALRLGTLAAALLDLAAAESSGRRLTCSMVNVREVLQSVTDRLRPFARQRSVVVRVSVADRSARLDRVRVEQAIGNVLLNAITYAPQGGEVQLRLADEPQNLDLVKIRVLDRGPGVPPEFVARLYDPFQRGPNATGTGSGLGLATARAAVRAHGGELSYEPRPGGGSCVTLSFRSAR